MRLTIISDIHSNYYALHAVLNSCKKLKPDAFIVLGDIFGYYPWASETYHLIKKLPIFKILKGNHDFLLLGGDFGALNDDYIEPLSHNRNTLLKNNPDALSWLEGLDTYNEFYLDNVRYFICHGTPDDTINGRFYPDNNLTYKWFPEKNHIVMMGHTHYPLYITTEKGGIINPGSVGQPRDGLTSPSWAILDTLNLAFDLFRTDYEVQDVINYLIKINWNKRAINALKKNYKGNLLIERHDENKI